MSFQRNTASRIPRLSRSLNTTASSSPAALPSTSSRNSHVLAGLAGGGIVLVGGYATYHLSGAKTAVDTLRSTKAAAETARAKISSVMEKSPDYELLKPALKTLAVSIPGGSWAIDALFVQLDKIRESHGKEIDEFVKNLWEDVKGGKSLPEIMAGMSDKMESLQKLVSDTIAKSPVSKDSIQVSLNEFVADHPELKKTLQSALKKIQDAGGDTAAMQETISQMMEIAKEGVNADSIQKMKALAEDRMGNVTEGAEKIFQDLISKNEQLKTALAGPIEQLKNSGSAEVLQATWADLSKLASKGVSMDTAMEAKKIIEKRLEEAKKSINGLLKEYPELQKVLEPATLKEIGVERGQQVWAKVSALVKKDGLSEKTLKKAKEIVEAELKKAQKDLKK